MYKILMMIQVIIMKILAKCKFGGETMICQFAKFSLPPKLVVVRYVGDLIAFFNWCKSGLTPAGMIFVKENVAKKSSSVDDVDHSVTR